jgi:single-stranded DNA-binding protein
MEFHKPKCLAQFNFRGNFSQVLKEGTYRTHEGNLSTWVVFLIYVYTGKDKQTNQNKYENFSISVYGADAEMIKKLDKKTPIHIEGNIKNNVYQNKHGENVHSIRFIAQNLTVGDASLYNPQERLKDELNAVHLGEEETVDLL